VEFDYMDRNSIEVVIEPYHKIIVHEIVEYRLSDWVNIIITEIKSLGGSMPTLFWCNGVVFQSVQFNTNSETVIKQQLNGIIHYSSVTFALKEKFQNEIRTDKGMILLVDVSANINLVKLAEVLKGYSKLKE
jgi:hypothetical protein